MADTNGSELIVGDKKYILRERCSSYCSMEGLTNEATGLTLVRAMRGDLRALCAMFWALLQSHHAAEFPTIESVSQLVDEIGMAEMAAQVQKIAIAETPSTGSDSDPVKRRKPRTSRVRA